MPARDHIHLSMTIGDSPENAPDMKWWVKADGWKRTPRVIANYNWSLSGRLIKHVLRDDEGEVIHFLDNKYILRVSDYEDMTTMERMAALEAMQGETVYLCDEFHAAVDGADHTTNIRRMYCASVGDYENVDPGINLVYAVIELIEDREDL